MRIFPVVDSKATGERQVVPTSWDSHGRSRQPVDTDEEERVPGPRTGG